MRSTSELPIIPPPEEIKKLEEELKKDPNNAELMGRVLRIRALVNRKLPELDDITFRAVTEPLDLGPTRHSRTTTPSTTARRRSGCSNSLAGDKAVEEDLVNRYLDELGLETITDYRSPTRARPRSPTRSTGPTWSSRSPT